MTAKRLVVLCPQEYIGLDMRAVPCTGCSSGWDVATKSCLVPTGVEHLPLVAAEDVPRCPLEDRCQHQLQSVGPCAVRARGLICESALSWAGDTEPENHPLGFNANVVADVEDFLP